MAKEDERLILGDILGDAGAGGDGHEDEEVALSTILRKCIGAELASLRSEIKRNVESAATSKAATANTAFTLQKNYAQQQGATAQEVTRRASWSRSTIPFRVWLPTAIQNH